MTGLERTLLDCASVPENAGGIANVIEAFERGLKRLDYEAFLSMYRQLSFKYPHWQRIGLLFEKLGAQELAQKWKAEFGTPMNKFFISKEYKLDWEFDASWKIYYPTGLFG
jgi:predicted transcriptional regulator of viral defense system